MKVKTFKKIYVRFSDNRNFDIYVQGKLWANAFSHSSTSNNLWYLAWYSIKYSNTHSTLGRAIENEQVASKIEAFKFLFKILEKK